MRPTVLALVVALAFPVLAGVTPASPAGAAAATAFGPSGFYSAVDRVRALDTRGSGMIPAHGTVAVRVTGLGGIPATNVVAVSANLTVLSPSSTGSLSAFADGTSWSGATMSFQAGQTAQNFETIPVSAGGMIDVRNNTAGPLNLIVDVLGYHGQGDAAATKGRYQPMSPTRLLDTRTGQPVAAGQTRAVQVAGVAGIPLQGDSLQGWEAVVVNVTVLAPRLSGSLTVGMGNLYGNNTPSLSFAAGQNEQSQLLMGLDTSGALPIRNNSAAAVQVIADVVGYYTGLTLNVDQGFWADSGYARAYDSRAAGSKPIPPGGMADVQIWLTAFDWGGRPWNGVSAGSINVTVLTPTTDGSISVRPADTSWDGAATVSFTAGQTRQRMLMAKVGAGSDIGAVWIRNNSSAPITLIVDLNGWSA
jgi:hypothetical protein